MPTFARVVIYALIQHDDEDEIEWGDEGVENKEDCDTRKSMRTDSSFKPYEFASS